MTTIVPSPRGRLADGVLVTNLANRVQPIIRYQMGDRVAIEPDPCVCGSPFPQIQVIGRSDDILTFLTPQGEPIHILPICHCDGGRGDAGRGQLPARSARPTESHGAP